MRKILYHEDEKQQFYIKLNQTGQKMQFLTITPGFRETTLPSVAETVTTL